MNRFAIACGLALLASGCGGGRSNVMSAHNAGKGTDRSFEAPVDQVWNAAHAALTWHHAEMIEEHKDQGFLIGMRPTSLERTGATMGVWIVPAQKESTARARVVISHAALTSIGETESGFLDDMTKAIGILKSGGTVE